MADSSPFKESKVIKKKGTFWRRIGNKINGGVDFILQQLNLDIKTGSDGVATIKAIDEGIDLKGYNLSMIIFSALLACVGLNTDSGAVIIGAMLISPLMNPILGVGLGFGIDEPNTLFRSLKNLGLAILASLFFSSLYFLLTPIKGLTSEIAARTEPTLLDAGVALFGGLAGIVTQSRAKASNAIPGVAIATALMPPICSAGYGLANGEWAVFGGAFYLFFINAVLISLSAFLIIRYLGFNEDRIIKKAFEELKEDEIKVEKREKERKRLAKLDREMRQELAQEKKERDARKARSADLVADDKNTKTYKFLKKLMPLFILIAIIPSVYFFWNLWQRNRTQLAIQEIIKTEVTKLDRKSDFEFLDKKVDNFSKTARFTIQFELNITDSLRNVIVEKVKDKQGYALKLYQVNVSKEEQKQIESEVTQNFYKLESDIKELKREIELLKNQKPQENELHSEENKEENIGGVGNSSE